jgi:hypothetical protein
MFTLGVTVGILIGVMSCGSLGVLVAAGAAMSGARDRHERRAAVERLIAETRA